MDAGGLTQLHNQHLTANVKTAICNVNNGKAAFAFVSSYYGQWGLFASRTKGGAGNISFITNIGSDIVFEMSNTDDHLYIKCENDADVNVAVLYLSWI